ncbi:MAG: hypothetical protein RR341_05805, partial [Bacteroidales bacterium]
MNIGGKGDMTFLILLFGVLLAAGLFLIAADLLRLPSLATQKAMLAAGRQSKAKAKTLETLLFGWAVKLSKFIRIDEYKRSRMANVLSAAGLNMTPEVFTASALVKAGAIALGAIPCLLLLPLL